MRSPKSTLPPAPLVDPLLAPVVDAIDPLDEDPASAAGCGI
jgi:hypothetical protein